MTDPDIEPTAAESAPSVQRRLRVLVHILRAVAVLQAIAFGLVALELFEGSTRSLATGAFTTWLLAELVAARYCRPPGEDPER
jgi:hypothetical protein